jgi:hypothetical protein
MQPEIKAVCLLILSQVKTKKMDLNTIYRLITSKKNRISVSDSWFDLEEPVTYQALHDFIKTVNPYFDFKDTKKLERYRIYFLISKQLLSGCEKLQAEAKQVAYYKIKNVDDNRFLSVGELDEETPAKDKTTAFFFDMATVESKAYEFLKLYKFLKIEKQLQILCFNSQDQVIDSQDII